MNQNIRIILVNPSHPGNIGAVARAMKTMELRNLYLVTPKTFPHVDATARAAGADDILANAIITPTLATALKGTQVVFGTSSRTRALSLPKLNPKEAAQVIINEEQTHAIALVFGRENNGLTNEEMELCNYHLYIPTNASFYSLNLAAAVQLVTYEIKMARDSNQKPPVSTLDLATAEEIQLLYQQLQRILIAIDFLDQKNPPKVLSRLKLLFNRAHLEKKEVNILRGILTNIETKIARTPND